MYAPLSGVLIILDQSLIILGQSLKFTRSMRNHTYPYEYIVTPICVLSIDLRLLNSNIQLLPLFINTKCVKLKYESDRRHTIECVVKEEIE